MKYSTMKALMVIVIAVLWAACAPQIYDGGGDDRGGDAAGDDGAPEGSVTLRVPRIAPSLARALGAAVDDGLSTQALMVVNRVDFELFLDGAPSDSLSVTLDAGPDESGETVVTWDVPAASGYTIDARVYNTNVSTDDPVLYGESVTFAVTSGDTTDIVIRPTPDAAGSLTIAPTTIPEAPSSAQVTLDSCYDTGTTDGSGNPIYGWLDEHWFIVDAPAGLTAMRVTADPDDASAVYMAVYDDEGVRITGALSGGMADGGPAYWLPGEPASVAFLSPELTYFVGLITVSGTEGSSVVSTVDVSSESFADDVHEENDAVGEAAAIAQAAVLSGVDLDQRADGGYTGGDWFSFTRGAADDENVTIVLEFDHDESDLALGLYTWSGNPADSPVAVTTSDTSAAWDEVTGQPGDLEEERIVQVLAVGDYYIWVYSNESPVGSAYNLQWVAGEGTVSIGLE